MRVKRKEGSMPSLGHAAAATLAPLRRSESFMKVGVAKPKAWSKSKVK